MPTIVSASKLKKWRGEIERENHYFFVLWLSGLQNDLSDIFGLFQFFMAFLMSFKANRIKKCQIPEEICFLIIFGKILPKLAIVRGV